MNIVKYYAATLNVQPQDLYTRLHGENGLLMRMLSEKFKNRCVAGGFVLDITRIINTSELRIERSNTRGSGSIDVRFEYNALVFAPGEILVGVEIQRIEQESRILGKYKQALVYMRGSRSFPVNSGKLIACVQKVSYPLGKRHIVLTAEPYMPERQICGYVCSAQDISTSNAVAQARDLYNQELQLAQRSKNYKQFTELLLPDFNVEKHLTTIRTLDACKIDEITDADHIFIMWPNATTQIYEISESIDSERIKPLEIKGFVQSTLEELVIARLEKTRLLLKIVRMCAENYEYNQNDAIWKYYAAIKKA